MSSGKVCLAALLLLGGIGVSVSRAHEGHDHKAMGTCSAVNADKSQIEIKTVEGKTLIVVVSGATRYKKAGAAASLKELQPGQRVAVTYQQKGSELQASEVLIGVMEGAAKP